MDSAEQILPGLYRVVVPLPGNPLKEVNSYVLVARDRNLVIDTGMNRPECRAALDAGLDEIGVDLDRTDFVATHLHADHHGLIPELLRPGRHAFMGEGDARAMGAAMRWEGGGSMGRYLMRSGFPAAELEESFRDHPAVKYRSERTVSYRALREGDTVAIGDFCFETIDTPGHTFGHVSFYDARHRLFLAGDHVLGDITPNIQAWSDDHDPLALYLGSLTKVERLEVRLGLPGHRSLITDFAGRVAQLHEHHRQRANQTLDILTGTARNAYQTAAEMSWDIRARSWLDFPLMQRWFATGETIAHLRYLEQKGLVEREETASEIRYRSRGRARL